MKKNNLNNFEMDGHGNFRFSVAGKWSDWVGYQSIASILSFAGGNLYIAVSQYYEGTLPPETIILITPLKTNRLPENLEHKTLEKVAG